jgi:sodium/potassium/calcium exchanger 6
MATIVIPRRRRPAGQAFYTTALVVTLFAVYSVLRDVGDSKDSVRQSARLALRSLEKRDGDVRFHLLDDTRVNIYANTIQCRFVHKSRDNCAYVRSNCPDEEAGLISYLQLYYCSLANAKPLAFTILVLWISLLFSTIGIAASDFLCINLSTIAKVLGMSESLTGVTFLAFGNGSPDVFSTFAAMSTHSGSLAVGELMGAAGFITAVVAGSMALVKPFKVAKKSFIRDVGFFAVAASFSLVFLADGSLRLWECASMVGFYVFYVIFVVTWHWWLTRRRRIRLRENTARLDHHIPGTQELEVPEIEEDEDSRPAAERRGSRRNISVDDFPTLEAGTPAWALADIDDDDEERDRYLAELRSRMRVSRPQKGERRNTITPIRPSLIGALEFRAVLGALERKSTAGSATNIHLRRYSDDATNDHRATASVPDLLLSEEDDTPPGNALHPSQASGGSGSRNRAVSANDAVGLRISTNFLEIPGRIPESAVSSSTASPTGRPDENSSQGTLTPTLRSPQVHISPPASLGTISDDVRASQTSHLSPFTRPDYSHGTTRSPESATSPMLRGLQVPKLQLPIPDHSKPLLGSPFPSYMESPGVITPAHSKPPSIRLPEASLPAESGPNTINTISEEEEEFRTYRWWPYAYAPAPQVILSTLFPTLYGWKGKSIWDKMLGLATAPSVFLLTITLPVVENEEKDEPIPDPGLLTPHAVSRSRSSSRAHLLIPGSPYLKARRSSVDAPPHPHNQAPTRQTSDYFPKAADNSVVEMQGPKDWNRWLVITQVFTAPLFVVFIVWANMEELWGVKTLTLLVIGSLVFSLLCLLLILGFTAPDRSPKYRPLFCFLGFAVAIAWISTIANEVVGVLKAFGVILGISDAILGLTIFAVGNSLGDLVADITVAKLGFPVMALSACFGGPMLNILLGIGLSGMYMTIHKSEKHHRKHPKQPVAYQPFDIEVSTTLMISGVTLLVTLVGLLIVVPLNGWRMDRKIGWGLIILWSLSTIGNVVVEVLGYGGELAAF